MLYCAVSAVACSRCCYLLPSLAHLQLAINNVLAPYLGRQFNFSTVKAANFAATFGLMNIWARPLGGFMSDYFGRR